MLFAVIFAVQFITCVNYLPFHRASSIATVNGEDDLERRRRERRENRLRQGCTYVTVSLIHLFHVQCETVLVYGFECRLFGLFIHLSVHLLRND